MPSELGDSYRDVCVATKGLIEFVPSLKRQDSKADGPCGIHQWRHNGIVTEDKMQPKTWKLTKYLYEHLGRKVPFGDLIGKGRVFGDGETDDQTIAKQGRNARAFFRKNGIPLTISSTTTVPLIWMEKVASE